MNFSSGKLAHGFCERCGLRYRYKQFKTDGDTGSRVCPSCWDPEHPQEHPEKYTRKLPDAEALRHPLPETGDGADIGATDAQDYIDEVNARR